MTVSTPEPIIIVGAGGFGRKTVDVISRINSATDAPCWDLLGFVDDTPSPENLERARRQGTPYLGSIAEILGHPARPRYVVGIGSPAVRQKIANIMDVAGFTAATLIDPSALIGSDVTIGAGSIVCYGAAVDTNVSLGRHVHVGFNLIIGHDATIGNFVSLSPLSAVSGDCVIEDGVLIGVAGVVMLQRRVGKSAVVGTSACVSKNVPAGAIVKGVPAR